MRFAREVFNDIWNMLLDFSTFYPGPSKWLGQSRPGSRPPRPGRWPPGPAHTFKSWKGCLLTKHTFISRSFGWLWLARLWETLTCHVANRKWVDFFAPKKNHKAKDEVFTLSYYTSLMDISCTSRWKTSSSLLCGSALHFEFGFSNEHLLFST